MREVFRSSDPVELDFVMDVLAQDGIAVIPLQHDNFRETLPTQIFVSDDDFSRAAELLQSVLRDVPP